MGSSLPFLGIDLQIYHILCGMLPLQYSYYIHIFRYGYYLFVIDRSIFYQLYIRNMSGL